MQSLNRNFQVEVLDEDKHKLQEIGELLKVSREKKLLTLRDIKDLTNIPIHHILAIENGIRENLPEDFCLIGFIRIYAKALGLDEKGIVNLYSKKTATLNQNTPHGINNEFDLLFDKGGNNKNLFRREKRKSSDLENKTSLFNAFHFYLFIGFILLITATYLIFNLIVNNPFDPKDKTYKEIIVENEEDFSSEDIEEDTKSLDEVDNPVGDVVMEFKKTDKPIADEIVDDDMLIPETEKPVEVKKPVETQPIINKTKNTPIVVKAEPKQKVATLPPKNTQIKAKQAIKSKVQLAIKPVVKKQNVSRTKNTISQNPASKKYCPIKKPVQKLPLQKPVSIASKQVQAKPNNITIQKNQKVQKQVIQIADKKVQEVKPVQNVIKHTEINSLPVVEEEIMLRPMRPVQ